MTDKTDIKAVDETAPPAATDQATRRVQGRELKLPDLDADAWTKILAACGTRKWQKLWLELKRTGNQPADLAAMDALLASECSGQHARMHPAWGSAGPLFNDLMKHAQLPYCMVRTPDSSDPNCYRGTVQIMEIVSDKRRPRRKPARVLEWV